MLLLISSMVLLNACAVFSVASIAELIFNIEAVEAINPFNDAHHAHRNSFFEGQQNFGEPDSHHSAWMNSGKFQGDIAGVPFNAFDPLPDGVFRNAVKDRSMRWPNGIVPYVIAPVFTHKEKQVIKNAMSTYHHRTCLQFVPRTNQYDYIHIYKDHGCYSLVGRVGGKQDLSLGRGCLFHEIAVHELMHALGFWHEHSRADRDAHIQIQWLNVSPNMYSQFDKIDYAYSDFLQEPYDYYSVMHYDSRAFSRNGQNTLIPIKPGYLRVIGRAMDLSPSDIRKVNRLYDCPPPTIPGIPIMPTAAPFRYTTPPRPIRTTVIPTTHHPTFTFPTTRPVRVTIPTDRPKEPDSCVDQFLDCPFFERYCSRDSFKSVMVEFCPRSCGYCSISGNTGKLTKPAQQFAQPNRPWPFSFN